METAQLTDNIEYAGRVAVALDRKFTDQDLVSLRIGDRRVDVTKLRIGAQDYVKLYVGSFDYVRDLQTKAAKYGLSTGQLRGALNCIRAEALKELKPAQQLPLPTGKQPKEGRYTVDWANGSWAYLRVAPHWDEKARAKGVMTIALDVDGKFRKFANIVDGTLYVWGKAKTDTALAAAPDAARILLQDPEAAQEAYAVRFGKCSRCNRALKVPTSIHRGLGPECAKK